MMQNDNELHGAKIHYLNEQNQMVFVIDKLKMKREHAFTHIGLYVWCENVPYNSFIVRQIEYFALSPCIWHV
jgi:hypothetical protein